MIILNTDDKSLQVFLGGAVAANELDMVASFVDIGKSDKAVTAADSSEVYTTGATPIDLVPAPDANNTRQVKFVSIYNADSQDNIVSVRIFDDGTANQYLIVVKSLAPGETLQYTEGIGWEVIEVPSPEFIGQQIVQAVNIGLGPSTIFTATARTKITQIHISNQSGANSTFDLWIDTNGAVTDDATNLALDAPINKDSFVLLADVTYWLEIDGTISVGQGASGAITWTIDGEVLT